MSHPSSPLPPTWTFDLYKADGHANLPPFQRFGRQAEGGNEDRPKDYVLSDGLRDAVNVALALGQPLLLTGEPGVGKTGLASHVADFFNLGKPLVYPAQTTSAYADLFYLYDALGHFQHVQSNGGALSRADMERLFIQYNALGEAIKGTERKVVLIDEIDKAPRDLPNDLLLAIDRLSFKVPPLRDDETKKVVEFEASPANRPVIIITSNSEKGLPDAFLRRVAYYHIRFEELDLEKILAKKTGYAAPEQRAKILDWFKKIRAAQPRLNKLPATGELIAWALLLQCMGFPVEKLGSTLTAEEKNRLHISYSALAKTDDDLKALKENF